MEPEVGRSPTVGLTRRHRGPLEGISLQLRDACRMSGFSTPQKRSPVPGNHITDQQVRLYMDLRLTHTREAAAAKAGRRQYHDRRSD